MLIGFAFVALPAIDFSRVVKKEKYRELKRIDEEIADNLEKETKKRQIESISSLIFESSISKITLTLSFVTPIATIIIQILNNR